MQEVYYKKRPDRFLKPVGSILSRGDRIQTCDLGAIAPRASQTFESRIGNVQFPGL